MMPTLLDGDFIVVNKYAYGLRLPVLDTKILNVGSPQRGDVVVFRYPPDPAVNYIKRLVGLPGDRVQVHNDQLIINGQPQPMQNLGRYNDGCYANMQLSLESIGTHRHEMMSCRTPEGSLQAAPVASCNRGNLSNYSYLCVEDPSQPDYGDTKEIVVPPGQYFMVGDNRDNSADGRYFGFVPEANLVGKASRIWFNLDLQRSGGPMWKRIGRRIE
jgi:signal peptidase I